MATQTTTTTTTTTSTQQNQQLVVGTSTSSYNLGSYVTDVSVQPYIAPRIVSFRAVNMRPNARMHIFFDSVNVDAYCAPGTLASDYSSRDTSDYNVVTKNGNWGDAIYSDSNGYVHGQFAVPEATFKTGDRLLQICDVTSIKTGNDAITTTASASFTASNIAVTKQSITLTTVNPTLSTANVTNTVITQNVVSNTVVLPDGEVVELHVNRGYDPIAQTFRVRTPNNEAGIFVTSIDVYFKQKSLIGSHGVTVFLCGTNNGYPDTSTVLPFSSVHLDSSQLNVSDDATVPTTFLFEAPVFLATNQLFSFIVKPDANDPDILVWFAALGDLDVSSGGQVYSQPTEGNAFYGASTTGWTALQSEYIKYTLKRADFTAQYGDVAFVNVDRDYLKLPALSFNTGSSGVLPGDYVYGAGNATPSTANVSYNGILKYYNDASGVLAIDTTTGNFGSTSFVQIHRFANSSVANSPNTQTLVAYANVSGLYSPPINAIVPRFAAITPAGTALNFTFKGTSNSYVTDANSLKVIPDTETELRDYERILASRSLENASLSGGKSATIHATMTSDSSLISPVIDTVRSNFMSVHNKVDGLSYDLYDEMYNYGAAMTKYISPIVTLNDGMDAEDLQVRLTAYRPYSSFIFVYVKFLNAEDGEAMTDKTWTPLALGNNGVYSDYANPADFREYNYFVPGAYRRYKMTGTASVTNGSNTVTGTSTEFTSQLKVGRWIGIPGHKTRKVTAITSDTSFSVDTAFTSSSSNNIYLVPPKTTAYLAANTVTQRSGTVTASTTSNIITGSGTAFTTEFNVGDWIGVGVGGDMQRVISIANTTSLAVETPWSSAQAGAPVYNITSAGVTYLNNAGNVFTGFKRFQIKIVLLSDDSSKVPVIDDLQAVCLQM